jgi:hypothetical protein
LLEEEIRRADDTLVTLSVFELLYEVAILSLFLCLLSWLYMILLDMICNYVSL